MPSWIWKGMAGVIVLLLAAVVGLDRWQTTQGEPSLFRLARSTLSRAWPVTGPGTPRARALPEPAAGPAGARVAVIVDDLGGRRDVFESLVGLGRPLSVAVLPELPLSTAIARAAVRAGIEVLIDLPMEPYRYPELDPGPGALLRAMTPAELRAAVARHLAALPEATGVMNHMGSRLTEDRERVRALLEPLRARALFFVDAFTTNLSVGYDEAAALGVRAARRHVLVDHAGGEAGDRAAWDRVAPWVARRGEAVVIAHGHPLTARLLREYIPRWEARGIRLVRASELAR
jgi:uncharacterized protein